MGDLNAGILIDGVIDGTTIGYEIVVLYLSNNPLEQWFDSNSGNCSPDWAAAWADMGQNPSSEKLGKIPRLYIKARDLMTGADVTNSLTITSVSYNGVSANWENNKTAFGDIIKMVKGGPYGHTYDDGTDVPTVMFIGNPADNLANPDSDRIAFSGTVATEGSQVTFRDLGKTVDIHPYLSGDVGYSVLLTVPQGDPYIATKQSTTKRVAALRHQGAFVNPANTPHIIKFYDATGESDVELTGAAGLIGLSRVANGGGYVPTSGTNAIEIYPDAVQSMMTLRCNVYSYENNVQGRLLASGLAAVYDLSDEFQVKWKIADDANFATNLEVLSNQNLSEGPRFLLRKGDEKYVKPVIVTGKDGTELPGEHTWAFNADDPSAGGDVTDMHDACINNHTAGQTFCRLYYDDVIKTGGVRRPVKLHARTTI